MNYTKQQRMEIAEAFRAARKIVDSGAEDFICCALQISDARYSIEARHIISSRIKPYGTLNDWLKRNYEPSESHSHKNGRQMRLYRLRWLDALIEEFSK